MSVAVALAFPVSRGMLCKLSSKMEVACSSSTTVHCTGMLPSRTLAWLRQAPGGRKRAASAMISEDNHITRNGNKNLLTGRLGHV